MVVNITFSNRIALMDTTRKRRWNRRLSDGAAFDTLSIDGLSEENQSSSSSLTHSSSRSIHHNVASSPLLNREPFHVTEELRTRINEAIRYAITTFVTFGVLDYKGQSE